GAFEHEHYARFAGARGVRFANPSIADGSEVAIDINQRQTRAFPRWNARLLQQLLYFVRVSAHATALAAAPKTHVHRVPGDARSGEAGTARRLRAQPPSGFRDFERSGEIPTAVPSERRRTIGGLEYEKIAIASYFDVAPPHHGVPACRPAPGSVEDLPQDTLARRWRAARANPIPHQIRLALRLEPQHGLDIQPAVGVRCSGEIDIPQPLEQPQRLSLVRRGERHPRRRLRPAFRENWQNAAAHEVAHQILVAIAGVFDPTQLMLRRIVGKRLAREAEQRTRETPLGEFR